MIVVGASVDELDVDELDDEDVDDEEEVDDDVLDDDVLLDELGTISVDPLVLGTRSGFSPASASS